MKHLLVSLFALSVSLSAHAEILGSYEADCQKYGFAYAKASLTLNANGSFEWTTAMYQDMNCMNLAINVQSNGVYDLKVDRISIEASDLTLTVSWDQFLQALNDEQYCGFEWKLNQSRNLRDGTCFEDQRKTEQTVSDMSGNGDLIKLTDSSTDEQGNEHIESLIYRRMTK